MMFAQIAKILIQFLHALFVGLDAFAFEALVKLG